MGYVDVAQEAVCKLCVGVAQEAVCKLCDVLMLHKRQNISYVMC